MSLSYQSFAGRISVAADRATKHPFGVVLYVAPYITTAKKLRWLIMTQVNWQKLVRQEKAGGIRVVGVFVASANCQTREEIAAAMTKAAEGFL